MPLRQRLVQLAFDRGGLIGLITLVLYVWLAPEHIVDGDNAEFATLGALGGTAHPTGYPAYILWLRLWSWLPAATPAHAAAIATAMLGAAQMTVLVNAARAWGLRTLAANAAVLIFAGSPVVLAMYSEAEVFAMNGLVASLILWLSAQRGPLRGTWRVVALAFVAGLGMANHVTCTLLAPVGLLGAIRGLRETAAKPRAIACAVGALALGLTPYLYPLLVAPDHAGTWGKPETFGDLVAMFLREDYGGPGAFAARGDETYPIENLVALGQTFVRAWLWLPGIAGLVALGYRIARPGSTETRLAWALLAISFLVSGPLLVLRFNLLPTDAGAATYVVERFHLLPLVIVVLPVAAAFDLAATKLREGLLSPALGAVVLVLAFAAVAGRSLPHIQRAHVPAVDELVRNTLRTLPPNAVVIGASDDLKSGTAYLQLVEGIRPDVYYINWPMMHLGWYRERITRDLGIQFRKGQPGVASVNVAEAILAAGRPLFTDAMQGNILRVLPHYWYATLYRVLPRDQPAPTLDQIFELNKELYAKFELSYPRPGPNDRWPSVVHFKYAWTWRQLAVALRKAGKHEAAAWALAAARDIGPQP